MNIVQVTPTTVYPPDSGGRHRMHGLLTDFIREGDSVRRICQGGKIQDYLSLEYNRTIEIEPNYHEEHHLCPPYDLTSLPVLYDYSYAFLDVSLSIWPPAGLTRLESADAVMVEGPWQLMVVERHAAGTPVIYSSHNVESRRHADLKESVVGRLFLRRTAKLESRALANADLVVCTSEVDREEYRRRYDFDGDAVVLPNGTYRESLQHESSKAELAALRRRLGLSRDATVSVFVGSNYKANAEGIELVIDEIRSDEQWDDIHLVVVGEVCDRLDAVPSNVHLVGFVDDIKPYIALGDVCLNPVVSGSGSNVKMFDYFSQGVPTVTTRFGARGIDVRDGENVFVADIQSFVDVIDFVVENPEKADEVAAEARRTVEREYTWESISAEYRAILRDTLL